MQTILEVPYWLEPGLRREQASTPSVPWESESLQDIEATAHSDMMDALSSEWQMEQNT